MPVMRSSVARIVGAWLGAASVAFAEDGGASTGAWETVREEKGISVHRRVVTDSPLQEFRGRGVIEAPLERVFAVIRDADRRTEWMQNCRESRFVERGEEHQILYNRTHAPWPAWDRDVVLKGTIRFDPAGKALFVLFEETTHADVPPKEGVMRMPLLRGHWRLEPRNGNTRTFVEYQVHANPGGQLPPWVANLVSAGIPFHTLEKLRAQVVKASYPEYEAAFRERPGYRVVVGEAAGDAPTTTPAP